MFIPMQAIVLSRAVAEAKSLLTEKQIAEARRLLKDGLSELRAMQALVQNGWVLAIAVAAVKAARTSKTY